jgi:glycosidase
MHGLVYTLGGIPLLYLGDEIAQPNDPTYTDRPAEAADNRWVHRPFFSDARLTRALDERTTPEGRVLAALVRLGQLRKSEPALGVGSLREITLDPRYTLAFERQSAGQKLLIVANMSEHWVDIDAEHLGPQRSRDLWRDAVFDPGKSRTLEPYDLLILARA